MVATDSQARWAYLRSIKLFRPYRDAVPWPLFEALPPTLPSAEFEAHVAAAVDNGDEYYLRVAKQDEAVVGAYLMRRMDTHDFVLDYLAVVPAHRKRGLGSWLTGHAIGIAESKGGSSLRVVDRSLVRFFKAYGFADEGAELRFAFIPE